jgi:lysyl-tRNA synthetase class 2
MTADVRRRSVESSAVGSVGYDAVARTLEIEYEGGGVYRYLGVPPRAYELLLRSDSVGGYVNRRIKPYYRCVRVAT